MNRKAIVVVILLIAFIGTADAFKKGTKGKSKRASEDSSYEEPPQLEEMKVEIRHRPEECDVKTKSGDTVQMHYTGYLEDGSVFDSSVSRGTPFEFKLGVGAVILGWDRGLQGMCPGEKRRLVLPPHYAYGDAGYPPVIPASATLHFDVELVAIL